MSSDMLDVLDAIEDSHFARQCADLLARTKTLAGRAGPSGRRWLMDELEAFGRELAAGLLSDGEETL